MRRLAVSVTATVLAVLALLGMKAAAAPRFAAATTVARGGVTASKGTAAGDTAVGDTRAGDTVVVTGPQLVLAHGTVQVRVTIVGGRLVDVTALSLPHDNPHSWDDSTTAAVKLRSEVLSKQSADVSVVSGATYTSRGYLSSLQAALDVAGRR